MEAVNYSDLRQNLKQHLVGVYENKSPLLVTRKNNENVVIISLDEYNSLTETNYLLSSKNNQKHLEQSLQKLRTGIEKTISTKIDELIEVIDDEELLEMAKKRLASNEKRISVNLDEL